MVSHAYTAESMDAQTMAPDTGAPLDLTLTPNWQAAISIVVSCSTVSRFGTAVQTFISGSPRRFHSIYLAQFPG